MHTIDRRHHCFALVSVSIAWGVHYDGINRLFKRRKRFPEIGKMTNKKPPSLKCWMKPLKSANKYERSVVFQTGVVGSMLFSICTTDPSDAFNHLHHSSDYLRRWLLAYPVCATDQESTEKLQATCLLRGQCLCSDVWNSGYAYQSFLIFLKNVYVVSGKRT